LTGNPRKEIIHEAIKKNETGEFVKKEKNEKVRTGVSGAWAGSPCSRPAFLPWA
jgi:hypothetical protein